METRHFPTEDVLTVATGIALRDGADFHGVMDVLYPGIMTIGCAAMGNRAAAVLKSQHPGLGEFIDSFPEMRAGGDVTPEVCNRFIAAARERYGATMAVTGPVEVSNAEIAKAFNEFNVGAR